MYKLSINESGASLSYFKKTEADSFFDLHTLMMDKNYSAGIFKGSNRLIKNWEGQSLLIFDFDGFITMDAIKRAFKNYKYLIITTKSHNKLKNGIIAERFRLVLESYMDASYFHAENYSIAYKFLAEKYHADTSCSDVARFYWKSPKDAVYFYNDGEQFDLYRYLVHGLNKINEQKKVKKEKPRSTLDFMDVSNWFNMFKPESIGEGERNNSIARIVFWAIDNGCNQSECMEIAHWVNDRIPNPLGDLELEKIVLTKF